VTEEQANLFLGRNYGILATIGPDGLPHQTAVWVDWDGEYVLANTAAGRVKERNLRRDPQASVLVVDSDDPYRYVSVRGRATLVEEGAAAHIDRLARRYTGRTSFGLRPGERRVIVRVTPQRIHSVGFPGDHVPRR
jgi:PPOX class probable F420-dependent enzyme